MNQNLWRNFVVLYALLLQGCYFIDFFKGNDNNPAESSTQTTSSQRPVLGGSIGPVAGSLNTAALDAVYAVRPGTAPASVRPDPDLYVRRLLRQFRSESSTLARQIGLVEGYRLLLGGASVDFQKVPQTTYDATSLLANLSVSEQVCHGLVAPTGWRHQGWETILPHPAGDVDGNIRFLIQRITGRPSTHVLVDDVQQLQLILEDHREDASAEMTYEDYIPVCAVLTLDAEALLL